MNRIRALAIFGTSAAVGSYSSVSPSGPTMVAQIDKIPCHIGHHIADHGEGRDDLDLVRRHRGAGQQHDHADR